MTDDQWNNPWKDDPGHAADGDAQDQSLDRTTIRPRGDATSGSSPSSSASQGSAPDPWHDAGSSASAQQGSPQPAHGWQGWDQPGSPAPSGQQWTSEETRPLNDPYSGVNPQAGQWPSGPGQYGQPSAGGSQPSAPGFGQPAQQFLPQQAPGQPQPGQQPPAGGFAQPQPGQYGQPAPAYGPNGGFPAPQPKAPGFFANLFDTTFTRFVSPTIIKVVYIILIVLVALWYIGAVIGGFVAGPLVGIIALVVGAGAALLIIALSRMQLEYIVALIRTSEYTRDLKDHFVKED